MSKVIGIPDFSKSTLPRSTHFEEWEGVFHEHNANRAGHHFDIRLGDPQTGIAHSWVVRSLPLPGEKVLAVQQPDHDVSYMDFSGTIPSGYGAGKVSKAFRGKIEILKSEPNKISFNLYKGHNSVRLNLIKTGFGWLLVNSTLTTESRPDIPLYKPSYDEIKIEKTDISASDEIMAPKVDGAHNTIALRKDKPIEVTSYRMSKGPSGIIDHSFKTDLYKIIPPPELHDTILRAELFGVSPAGKVLTSTETAGLLNSEVWKSRSTGNKIGNIVIDVVNYQGKNVENEPYAKKLQILKDITTKIPQLNMPPLAITPDEKEKLISSVVSGTNPLTREGVVIYNLNRPVPTKAKVRSDIDVYVKDMFPGQGRLSNQMVGGFLASRNLQDHPNIRVGGGLNDKLRRDMFLHPEKYKGRLAKIYIQEEYPKSGKVRVPVFKEWRTQP